MDGLITWDESVLAAFDDLDFFGFSPSGPACTMLWVLGKAEELGLITEKERDTAFGRALTYPEGCCYDVLAYRNKYIILSYYLYKGVSRNRDRLRLLLDGGGADSASRLLFDNAHNYFMADLEKYDAMAKDLRLRVRRLASPFYAAAYDQISRYLEQYHDFRFPFLSANLQVLYPLRREPERNIPMPGDLFSYMDHFELEVGLCEKLGSDTIQKEITRLAAEEEIGIRKQIVKKEAMLAKKEERLEFWRKQEKERGKMLQTQYDEELQQIEKADRAAFSALHPELVGTPAFEEAFETYQLSFPDEHYDVGLSIPDPITIERIYRKKRRQYENERKELEAESEKMLSKLQLGDCRAELSLENIVRLRCLILYRESGEHTEERTEEHTEEIDRSRFSELLKTVPYDKAARIIASAIPGLSLRETSYLIG